MHSYWAIWKAVGSCVRVWSLDQSSSLLFERNHLRILPFDDTNLRMVFFSFMFTAINLDAFTIHGEDQFSSISINYSTPYLQLSPHFSPTFSRRSAYVHHWDSFPLKYSIHSYHFLHMGFYPPIVSNHSLHLIPNLWPHQIPQASNHSTLYFLTQWLWRLI